MSEQIFLNGSFVPKKDAKISIMDRGFMFGDGVYELIPVYNGKPFLLDEHLSRLDNSLSLIDMGSTLSEDFNIQNIISELINKNKYENHFIYIQITRGIDSDRQHIYGSTIQPTIIIMGQSYTPFTLDQIKKGFKATIHEDYRWRRANIKSISLLLLPDEISVIIGGPLYILNSFCCWLSEIDIGVSHNYNEIPC